MKSSSQKIVQLCILAATLFAFIAIQNKVYADSVAPGWYNAQGEQVTPAAARRFYRSESTTEAREQMLAPRAGLLAAMGDAAEASDEIVELSRALQHDPLQIYEYVRNHVDYVPYFGSLKGATLTYIDGSGNDFDQASLMIALLRESGYTAQYVYGQMHIRAYGATDQKDMQHWLGLDPNNEVIGALLANGGIPSEYSSPNWVVNRVWVQATIAGSIYFFDPAFKVYQQTEGIDLPSALGYERSSLLAAAGGTQGTDYIQNLNDTGLRSALNGYTLNLIEYIRTNYPNAHTQEIVGGRSIIPTALTALPASLDFPSTTEATWDDIPDIYAHKVRIRHGQIDQTLNIPDLAGQRLSLTYRSTLGAAASAPLASAPSAEKPSEPQKEGTDRRPAITLESTEQVLPERKLTGQSLEGSQSPSLRAAGSWDFGRISPTSYTEGTMSGTNPNSSTISLKVSLSSNPSGAYSIVSGGGTYNVGAGRSYNIKVRFSGNGQTPGTKSGELRIEWWANGSRFADDRTALTGIVARPPDLTGSYGANIGQRYLNDPGEGVCRLKNSGTLNLTINGITLNGSNPGRFQIVSGGGTGTLTPGQQRDITVRYLANAVGSHSANVHVAFTYDGLAQTVDLGLSGETVATPQAQLWLDDTLLFEESAPVTGSDLGKLTMSIDHPYSAQNGTFCDQSVEYNLKRGSTYAVIYDFGGSRQGRLLEKRQRKMQAYRVGGLSDTSREVLTETLNVMGMTWMRDTTLNDQLLQQISGVIDTRHHRFGMVAQESGYYIDVKAQLSSTISVHGEASAAGAYFKATSHLASAMEHGVLEQMQVDRPSVSTVKLLQLTNTQGGRVYRVTAANYAAVRPQLTGYSSQDLTDFQAKVNGGAILILPANGQIPLLQWAGKGYIDYFDGSNGHVGMIIGGDYHGGYGAIKAPVSIGPVVQESNVSITPKVTQPNIPAGEPVDMVSGAWMYDNIDLALSGGTGGLSLKRSYYSSNNNLVGVLGYGWSHNYNLYAEVHSSSEFGLGRRTPIDAAALISAAVVTLDVMSSEVDLKAWMIGALTADWAMDQLIDNAVSVHLETDVLTYLKLPGGTYALPPGVTSRLVRDGNLYRIDERFGRSISFNSANQVSQISDADGNHVTFSYSGGRLQGVADGFGHILTFIYTGEHLTSVRDSAARTVSYGYNAGNLETYTDAEGKVWTYGYDGHHRVLTLQDPLAVTTITNVYDNLDRVKTQIAPRQTGSATYSFYFSGYRNVEEDPDGGLTVHHFDELKRLIAVQDALGNKTTKAYDGQNHVIAQTNPRNHTTTYEYDGNHNLVKVTDALANETVNAYDNHFRLTDVTDPLGHTVHHDYDAEHHLIGTVTYPAQGQAIGVSKTHYANGLVNTSRDGRGVPTTLTYDSHGNPNTAKTGAAPAIDYDYDTIGRMTGLKDQTGASTTFLYDDRNLLLFRTDPLLKTEELTYYDDGKVHTRTDRNQATTTYTYTRAGKPDTVTYQDGATVSFTYDQHDNLTGMQDSAGTATYAYDGAKRLTTATDANGFTVVYDYDEAGNLTRLTYPGNRVVRYDYDELNRLESVTIEWLGRTAYYEYDDAGRLTGLTQFNGTAAAYTYDNANRLTDLENRTAPSGTVIAAYHFTLDANGNRVHVANQAPLALAADATELTLAYNTQRNRLLSAGTTSFGYDDEGQLSTKAQASYSFDSAHRLTRISGTSNDEFVYDGAGTRLSARRNGTVTRYIHDAAGNLIAEANGATITRYYIHGAGLLALVIPDGTIYCYHFDATGHTVALTDASRTVVNRYAYTPFGNANQVESIAQPFRYVGQYGVMTEPNGLYYMRARYYDPQVGRFISEDPAGFDGGDVNLYAYVQNNPVMLIDPFGLCKENSLLNNLIGSNSLISFGYGQTEEEFSAARARTRTFIEMQDVAIQGQPLATIAFDVGGFMATQFDIAYANVPIGNKLGATALNFAGILGAVGAIPTAPTMSIGTTIDSVVFNEIGNLLQ
jgi:RHS repeat-associated protein